MKGQIEVHWTVEEEPGQVKSHCYVFDPGKDDEAARKFEELKEIRGVYDIRLCRVERFASCGG